MSSVEHMSHRFSSPGIDACKVDRTVPGSGEYALRGRSSLHEKRSACSQIRVRAALTAVMHSNAQMYCTTYEIFERWYMCACELILLMASHAIFSSNGAIYRVLCLAYVIQPLARGRG